MAGFQRSADRAAGFVIMGAVRVAALVDIWLEFSEVEAQFLRIDVIETQFADARGVSDVSLLAEGQGEQVRGPGGVLALAHKVA